MKRCLFLLSLILLNFSTIQSKAFAQTCQGLFKVTHVEEFMRVRQAELQDQVRNTAAKASLILILERLLPGGSYNVEVNGHSQGLAVNFDHKGFVQMRLNSGHLTQSEGQPLTQSVVGEVRGSRSGLAAQFQFLPGRKLVLTNTIITGDEKTYRGLTKREVRAEFDLSAGPITQIKVQETVSVTSVYRKDDTTFTVSSKVTILSRR